MKKLIAIALVAMMVMACAVSLADGETVFVVPNSAAELDLPAFETPVSVKTKTNTNTMTTTVTFGADVDEAIVNWNGAFDEDQVLEVVDRVATFSAAGHKYQPGVSGTAERASYTGDDVKRVITSGKYTNYAVTLRLDGRYLIEDPNGHVIATPQVARKVYEAAVATGIYNQYKPGYSYFLIRVRVDTDGDGRNDTYMWERYITYGTKVYGAAYNVTIGNIMTTHDRDGSWLSETITVENSDVFKSGLAGAEAYVTYKKVTTQWKVYDVKATTTDLQEIHKIKKYSTVKQEKTDKEGVYNYYHLASKTYPYLDTVTEVYPDGDVASVSAQFRNDKNKTLIHYTIEYRDGTDNLYRIQYSPWNSLQKGWYVKNGEAVYQNGSGRYFNNTWVRLANAKLVKNSDLATFASFANPPRSAN